jgi:hypothetical protein
MLFGAVTVIVVVAAADPRDGSTEALERALRSAVGDRAVVVVKTAREGDPEDGANGTTEPGAVVGVVTWSDHHRRATLRFQSNGRATDRELRFDASDAPAERGRTIGFAVASMVPEDESRPTPPKPPPVPIEAGPPATPTPTPTPAPAEAPSAPPRDPSKTFALDLTASGAVGIAGFAGGMGGALAGRIPLGRGFAARIGLSARLGEISPAQATSRAYAVAGGLAWQVWPTASRSFGLGVRTDLLLMRHEVVHFSSDDPENVSRSRFLPGVDVLLEGGIRLADHASVVVAFGPEIALGRTNIVVRGAEVGVVPPLRLCAEGGVRVSF